MKNKQLKTILFVALSLLMGLNVFAIPANPKPQTIKQPNGKTLTFTLKGDERVNWATTMDGYTLVHNAQGVFTYATKDKNGNLVASKFIAVNPADRTSQESEFVASLNKDMRYSQTQIKAKIAALGDKKSSTKTVTTGVVKELLVLVAFSDKPFTYTQANFDSLCNQTGYSLNGGTGSVHEYYYENSKGRMDLQITVVGPYTLPHTSAYYAQGSYSAMAELVSYGLTCADSVVDFTQFRNGDVKVGNIHFVFAGTPQSTTGDVTEIWPHKSNIASNIVKDGVHFSTYSCSAEKKSSTQMDAIGTMCHEMGHSFGLMDLYDTDYGSNGSAITTGQWSIMDQGSYNNNSNTPPYFNGWERQIVGWDSLRVISSASTVVLPAIADSNCSYKINLDGNEFYIIEHRKQKGFDSYLPGSGLLIFHGDQDKIDATFNYDDLNVDSTDRAFYLEGAVAGLSSMNTSQAAFGTTNTLNYFTTTTNPAERLKDGTLINKPITHIRYLNDSVMTFNYLSSMPQVNTKSVTYSTIAGTHATVNGEIVYLGNGTITERGFYWSTNQDSLNNLAATKVISLINDTAFSAVLTSLPTSTTIYYKAYAQTAAGTDYGTTMSFTTTDGLGTVITSSASQITDTSAILSGSIVSSGDDAITEKGFVISSTNQYPTLADQKVSLTDTAIGVYSCTVSGLSEQTLYYYRAYVSTPLGTKYGSKRSFTTTFPEITGNTISSDQSFCAQGTPQLLTGGAIAGGHGNFTYLWQQKVRDGQWTEATQTNTNATYQPETLTDSTFYRRIVFSNITLKDTSNTVLINVMNTWPGTLFIPRDTIEMGSSTGTMQLQSYKGTILNWERQRNAEGWTVIDRTNSTYYQTLDTIGLYSYRVKVQMGTCPEAYSSVGAVLVLNNSSLDQITLAQDMRLYPNPVSKLLNVTSSYTGEVLLRVVNMAGVEVMKENTHIQNKQIDVSSLSRGTYVITFSANGKTNTKTIIVR